MAPKVGCNQTTQLVSRSVFGLHSVRASICLPLPSGLVDLNAVRCQIPRDAFVDDPTLLGCASRIIQSRLGMIAGVAGLYRPFRQLGEIRAPNLYLPVLWQEVPERVQVVPERKRYLL